MEFCCVKKILSVLLDSYQILKFHRSTKKQIVHWKSYCFSILVRFLTYRIILWKYVFTYFIDIYGIQNQNCKIMKNILLYRTFSHTFKCLIIFKPWLIGKCREKFFQGKNNVIAFLLTRFDYLIGKCFIVFFNDFISFSLTFPLLALLGGDF